jgi:hypothetical protein
VLQYGSQLPRKGARGNKKTVGLILRKIKLGDMKERFGIMKILIPTFQPKF